jgi:Nif-specific regulatory protein
MGKKMDTDAALDGQVSLSANEFSLFYDVATSLHTIRDMDEMLAAIFRKITTIYEIEGLSIALHDPLRKQFHFIQTVEGIKNEKKRNRPISFADHQGIAGWVMETNQSAIINDVSRDERFFGDVDARENFSTRSMICVPLRTRRGFLGVLYALNKKTGSFTEREKKILEIFSGTIAVSIENARLYGELQEHLHSLEQEKRRLEIQVRNGSTFDEIIGDSKPMRQMFDLLDKVIDTPTTVLIQGETGTGKELIARVIHYNGPLKEMPFVAENCGALPDSLLESELFGHVRGAFTGAVANKKGLFEIADGGTIFLDEIGEMSPTMQVKLLRVLQEGQFRPVGSHRMQRVEVRIIASTNRDLAEEVKKGTFREDLFYRINVFQITPPPLRERKDDILKLATHFLERFAARMKRPVPRLSPYALDLLHRFDWPGNVRELENEMERALTMAGRERIITEECLSDKIRRLGDELEREIFDKPSGRLKDVVRRVEKRMISQALAETGGNRSRAARMLGLSRQGLLNKITAYSITG